MRAALAASLGLMALGASAATVPLVYVDGIGSLTDLCALRTVRIWAGEADDGALRGAIELGGVEHAVRVVPGDGTPLLEVDLGGDGTLTPIVWEGSLPDGTWIALPEFVITHAASGSSPYRVFAMWSPWIPTALFLCSDHYRRGTLNATGRAVTVAVLDEDTDGSLVGDGDALFVDVDGNGHLLTDLDSHERFALREPFVVDAVAYVVAEVAPDGAWIEVEVAAEPVQPKPSLLVGSPAPSFTWDEPSQMTTDLVSLRGKVVLLDFWAAWCQPCLAELPGVAALAAAFAEQGFEVVGVNVDRSRAEFEEAVAKLALPYRQAYDGPEGLISSLYRIVGIPMTYLIDCDGVIRGRGLRGSDLARAIVDLLAAEAEP